jgi:excisionase family DNA binding protein
MALIPNDQYEPSVSSPSALPISEESKKRAETKSTTASCDRDAFTLKETADRLGVSYHSVLRLVQRGKLRACHALPRKPLIPRKEIERLLKA